MSVNARDKYVGKTFSTNSGGDCIVVEYENFRKIKVKFLDRLGGEVFTRGDNLLSGSIKNPNELDLVGKAFKTLTGGDCVVISNTGAKSVTVKFLDEFGYETTKTLGQIKSGNVRNLYAKSVFGVGYIGEGKYETGTEGKPSLAYRKWISMLRRCYDRNFQKEQLSYVGCTVCYEWHNFQVFAEWFVNHKFYNFNYQLDKDILVEGNKIYSPNTCCLVPSKINCLLGNQLGEYPQGVCYDKFNNKFRATMLREGRHENMGRFDTIGEAELVYKIAKEAYVKEVALQYKEVIEDKVFKKLMSWSLN